MAGTISVDGTHLYLAVANSTRAEIESHLCTGLLVHIKVRGHPELVTVVGRAVEIRAGDWVIVRGT